MALAERELLGLCSRWPIGRCQAAIWREPAIQRLMTLNGSFFI